MGGEAFYRNVSYLSSVYRQKSYGFNLDLRKPLAPFTSISLDYLLRDVDIFDLAFDASPEIVAQAGNTLESQFATTLLYDSRDSVFLTRHGRRAALTPLISGGFLGGDVQTYGFNIEASQYILLPYDIILSLIGQVAVIDTLGQRLGRAYLRPALPWWRQRSPRFRFPRCGSKGFYW